MSLPRFSVDNKVLVNMMLVVTIAAGAAIAVTLVREMFPESRPEKIAITTFYPAIQPEEIEKAVTIKVEEAVRNVEGVEKIDSTVSEGFSYTIATLYNNVDDVNTVVQEIKNEFDAIQDMPDDIERTTIEKLEPRLPVIMVAVYGDGDEAALKRAARDIKDDLMLLPGVSEVELSGARDDEISVEIQPERLLEYDITFDEVADAIRQTNLDVSGGRLKGPRSNIALRTLGEENRGVDLEDIIVRSMPDGRKIYVSDIAIVRDAFVDSDVESYFNGKPAVNCTVYKTPSQDAIQIATLVKSYVFGKQGEDFDPFGFDAAHQAVWYNKPFALVGAWVSQTITQVSGRPSPEESYQKSRNSPFDHNFQVAIHSDLARYVEGRLDLMVRNGKMGLLLVLVSLLLFLNTRVAFWVAAGIPASILGTFVVMWIFGVSFNLLSLFGLIIVLGIIVDDAIVIGENIYRQAEEGVPPREAAIRGAEEVMWPVITAVLTTIAAFAPLLFIKGQIGDFMRELPIVVIAALSVSLLEALIVLPAHLSDLNLKKRKKKPGRIRTGLAARFSVFKRLSGYALAQGIYERFLRITLRWRYVTLAVGFSTLLMSIGLLAGGVVEWVFIQKIDSETLIGALEMPIGTTAENVRKRLKQLSDFAISMPEVVNVQSIVGIQIDFNSGFGVTAWDQSHLGQLIIELKAGEARDLAKERSSEDILAELRKLSAGLSGVSSVTWEGMDGGPAGSEIEIKVTGKDFNELVTVAEELKHVLAGMQGVVDLDDDFDKGRREVQLRLREAARPTGITVGLLGAHVRSAMYGREARRITRNREDVKIMVRYPESFRENVYHLENMWIPTPTTSERRGWIPLTEVATLTESKSYATIHRSQQERSVTVFGDVDQALGSTNDILAQTTQIFDAEIQQQHPNVGIEILGTQEEQNKAFSSLKIAFPVALLLIYMLLAGLFRSYGQPLVTMSAIPFGLQGAIIGHWLTGNPFTILSAIGLVALTGIVVNDSLIIVDFINHRVRQGMSEFEASVQGAKVRLRAIFLTTLTTAAGLMPLMFETSLQAKFLIPMAVTLTFGLIFATGLTLIIVPSLNMVFYDFRSLLGSRHTDEPPEADLAALPQIDTPRTPVPVSTSGAS